MNGPFEPRKGSEKWAIAKIGDVVTSPEVFDSEDAARSACNLINSGFQMGFAAGSMASMVELKDMLEMMYAAHGPTQIEL